MIGFCVCAVLLMLIGPIHNAPRSTPAKYDQKQSGEYNVQVHLKDFHIIAVLGDDTWGGNGDYDYNYDYSDLTIKPSVSLTTENPQDSNATSQSSIVEQQKPAEVDTEKVPQEETQQPDVITLPSAATTTNNPFPTIPVFVISESLQPQSSEKPSESTQKTTKSEAEATEKKEPSIANVSIVSLPERNTKINQNEQHLPVGEIMHYRRCSEGYSRDKQGRCRKIRRTPHIPFGITRFATNLASRFRQATIGGDSSLDK